MSLVVCTDYWQENKKTWFAKVSKHLDSALNQPAAKVHVCSCKLYAESQWCNWEAELWLATTQHCNESTTNLTSGAWAYTDVAYAAGVAVFIAVAAAPFSRSPTFTTHRVDLCKQMQPVCCATPCGQQMKFPVGILLSMCHTNTSLIVSASAVLTYFIKTRLHKEQE